MGHDLADLRAEAEAHIRRLEDGSIEYRYLAWNPHTILWLIKVAEETERLANDPQLWPTGLGSQLFRLFHEGLQPAAATSTEQRESPE